LDLDYLIKHTSRHGAKFCDDRPTKLRDVAMEKRKIINASKIYSSPLQKLSLLGRLIIVN